MDDFKPEIPDMLKVKNGKQEKVANLDLSIRSEEVQEIIGRPPHWLVRGGIGALFGVLALIFIAASFVKYPEVIKSQLILTAINAPKTVESKTSGKVVQLFKENRSEVTEGEVLGWMESTGSHLSVELLRDQIDSLQKWIINEEFSKIESIQISDIQQLGELQSTVQAFNKVFRDYILYLPGNYFDQRKEILKQEQEYTKDLLKKLELQQEIQKSNYKLAEQEFEAKKNLAEKGLIARLEFLDAESEFSNKKMPLQQTESAIINNRVSQISKQKELLELNRQENEISSGFKQSLQSLKSSINDWEHQYLLKAPVSGSLVYSGVIQEQQTLQSGQIIFFIVPSNTDFFGEMKISQASFGKIEKGQSVLVRFFGYPYHEFGSVMGEIEYISEFPVGEGELFAKVRFPEGLKTNYGNKLTPANGMEGEAEIITQDMRLLKRVYNNLTKELR
ncbi:MAG: HlyD family efflux transporter periplasmic adaptor subunit [Balneola sp.]|jgi:multidrug resistance efflux pump